MQAETRADLPAGVDGGGAERQPQPVHRHAAAEVDARGSEQPQRLAMPRCREGGEGDPLCLGIQGRAQTGVGRRALEVRQFSVQRQREGRQRTIRGDGGATRDAGRADPAQQNLGRDTGRRGRVADFAGRVDGCQSVRGEGEVAALQRDPGPPDPAAP